MVLYAGKPSKTLAGLRSLHGRISKLPMEFQNTAEVLPFTKYGLSTLGEFRDVEENIHCLVWFRQIGLTNEEIELFKQNEAGLLKNQTKIAPSALNSRLESIYSRIKEYQTKSSRQHDQPSSSKTESMLEKHKSKTAEFYPKGHPMNDIKDIEESLFGHLRCDEKIVSITKRRKILRRLERRKERILAPTTECIGIHDNNPSEPRVGSLWDVKDIKHKEIHRLNKSPLIGPKQQTMYTVKDNKIVRLEPIGKDNDSHNGSEAYKTVDIVVPVNSAEKQLLEGTKMAVDDIRSISRFKNYEPGKPSKVLYIKNISPGVTQERISLFFNQFALDNGGPVDIKLMSGRMRGQAFVLFQSKSVSIQALEEVNGTILNGKPLVIQFGREKKQQLPNK